MDGHEGTLLELRELGKQFSGTVALDAVNFDVRRGEIHALLGENGAGKSTLIKVLAGVHEADEGEVRLDGRRRNPMTERLPISFIHQELGLVGPLTVAENFGLVAGYPRAHGLIGWRSLRREVIRVLGEAGSDVDPDLPVSELSAAERSIVGIARALAVQAELVVLDEPTAALPAHDVDRLFATLERLRAQGLGIVYVTHRLDEVFRLADRVTVLRDGKRVATTAVAEISSDALVFQIVGRALQDVFVAPPSPSSDVLLEVEGLASSGVGPVSFAVSRGEMLGLVGLRGAGHEVIGRVLFGDLEREAGRIRLGGREFEARSVTDAMRAGVGFLSSNRAEEALAETLTVRENVFPRPTDRRVVNRRDEHRRCLEVLERFDVRPREPERLVATLSGGNQQKVALARWLEAGSAVLALEEPTTGVDVGAKADIYATLNRTVQQGRAVLLISSDFEEVARMCQRALVFNRGAIIAELGREQLSVSSLTQLASGPVQPQESDTPC